MKFTDLTSPISDIELYEWSIRFHENILVEDATVFEKILKTATDRVKTSPPKMSREEQLSFLNAKQEELEEKGVDENILQKFFSFFKKHPVLTSVGVVVILLLTPYLSGISVAGKIGIALSRIINLALSGLYVTELLGKKYLNFTPAVGPELGLLIPNWAGSIPPGGAN